MTRITVFNQKGGVGKTTTTLNLAALLARRGRDPLVIDLDPQGHLSGICGVAAETSDASLYGYYNLSTPLGSLIRVARSGLKVIPSHLDLAKVDSRYGRGPDILHRLNQGIVRENLNTHRPVLMDSCPMLGVLSLSGVFAADRVLIPISTDYLAMKGAVQMERTLRALEHVFKRRLDRRYLVTRFDTRRRMSWDIDRQLRERFGAEVCETRISENVSLAESPASERDVFEHAPESRGAKDYEALLAELEANGFVG